MPSVLWLIIAVLVVIAGSFLYFRKTRKSAPCANCGDASRFGYSKHAESARKDIVPLCLKCLAARLDEDYRTQRSRAFVIEPAANLPCYVFQPNSNWEGSKLADETAVLISNLSGACRHCERKASFLWTTSRGLLGSNFEAVFSEGFSQTLRIWGNPEPYPVCGACCARLIVQALEARNLSFLEICGPASEDGFVISMGY